MDNDNSHCQTYSAFISQIIFAKIVCFELQLREEFVNVQIEKVFEENSALSMFNVHARSNKWYLTIEEKTKIFFVLF